MSERNRAPFRRLLGTGATVGAVLAITASGIGWAAPTPDAGPVSGGTTVLIDCVEVSPIDMFAAGGMNAMIVTKDDRVLTWGAWQYGSNGNGGGSGPAQISQGAIPADADIIDADYDQYAGYVLTADGGIYAWGMNSSGQLGIGGFNPWESATPVKTLQGQIPAGVKPISIAAGSGRAAVLADNGWVYSWGEPSNGEGTNSWRPEPVALAQGQIPAGVTITQIANGNGNAYALGSDGWVYSWGGSFMGGNGDGNVGGPDRLSPVKLAQGAVPTGVTFTQVAAGSYVGYALGTDGKIYSWGNNGNGSLGIGDPAAPASGVPVAVAQGEMPAGIGITKIVASEFHTLVLADDGSMYSWGSNPDGQLGNNTTTNAAAPAKVDTSDIPAGVTITDIEVGLQASFGLGSDGRLYSWGGMRPDWGGISGPAQLGSYASEGRMRPGLALSFGVTEVTFDGIPGTDLDASGCPISVVTPPHVHGPVDVVVNTGLISGTISTPYQTSTVYPGGFTYLEPPVIVTPTLPDGTVGTGYTATVEATGPGPITFAVSAGALPPGIVFDGATGALSGTPTAAGTYTFTVTATNQYGTDTQEYTIVIVDRTVQPTPSPTPTDPSDGGSGGTGGGSGAGGGSHGGSASLAITGGTASFAIVAAAVGSILTLAGGVYLIGSRRRRAS
ncbi:putative Ig domain-containing protein [Microbacterium sp. NPDC057944]|uniref:RCC1 domain-containing protein n=1 Tax=Microbacterium sp. NPDC057944 TaxID=3346286 RepID=UPI0036DA2EF1